MSLPPDTIEHQGTNWAVSWASGYKLVAHDPDKHQRHSFRAKTQAFFDDQSLATLTIDWLKSFDRDQFMIKASSVNGLPPVDWDQLFDEGVNAILEQIEHGAGAHAILTEAEGITAEPIDWLWEPYVARKKLHMVDGDPGVGKTMWALQFAACISRGFPMPDQLGKPTLRAGQPAHVLLVGMEDGLADTVIPRLEVAKADLSKITIVNEVGEDNKQRPFVLSDLPLVEAYMQAKRPALVYIDAIQTVLGGKVDIHRANQVTEILTPLRHFAERYNAAILCTRHPAKPGQSIAKLIHRGMGSQAFIGSARLGLFVEEHPCDPTKALLVQSKSNAGDLGRTQIFSKREGRFEWCGVTRINKEMLAGSGKGPSPHAFLEACFWLEARLSTGVSYPAKEVQDDMKEEGIAHGTIFAAKKALGVIHTKNGTGGFTWYLPPLPPLMNCTTSTSSTTSTTSTSSTTDSFDKTRCCEDGEQLSDVYEADEVIDVDEVYGVVTHARDPEDARTRAREGLSCPYCGQSKLKAFKGDTLVCHGCGKQVRDSQDPVRTSLEQGSE